MNNRLLVSTFIFLSSFVVAQEIAWQQTLGGAREEHLYDAISTYDYGILLAGSSVPEVSGNKKDGSQGDLDYWLWKMTEDGKLEWQKNYGGAGNDYYGKYANDGVKKAFENRTGNIAEINLMLTAMLRYAGLTANPVLVSTKSHGIPITATLDGFNYVISALELQNKTILLDASNTYNLPNVLPKRAINWQGRLVRKDGTSSWISLQQETPILDSKFIIYKITSDLNVEGKVREQKTLQLAQRLRKKESKLTEEEKIEQLEDYDFDITVENIVIKNEDKYEKPYIKSFDFTSDELVEEIGDRLYISPLLFYAIEESPFKEETRTYPIDFIYPFKDTYIINITIPDGYAVDYLPSSSAAKLSDDNLSSYKYMIINNGKSIQLNINFDFNTSLVSVDMYKGFRQYFNSYLDKISEKIILKKIE